MVAISVLVDDDAADVLAVEHVLVPLVDLVQPVLAGDQLVQLEVTGAVQPEQPRYVVQRVAVAEQRSAQLALVADQETGVYVYRLLGGLADGRDRHLAALAGDQRRRADDVLGEYAGRADRVVGGRAV